MATIIQEYGPFIGESVNGTVSGRPNGSIYVPKSNKCDLIFDSTPTQMILAGDGYSMGFGVGYSWVAESQDPASYGVFQLYSDSACTQLIGQLILSQGQFNFHDDYGWYVILLDPDNPPTTGDKLYARTQLFSVSGDPVASSTALEVEMA